MKTEILGMKVDEEAYKQNWWKAYTLLLQIKDAFFKVVEIGWVGQNWGPMDSQDWWCLVGGVNDFDPYQQREREREKKTKSWMLLYK